LSISLLSLQLVLLLLRCLFFFLPLLGDEVFVVVFVFVFVFVLFAGLLLALLLYVVWCSKDSKVPVDVWGSIMVSLKTCSVASVTVEGSDPGVSVVDSVIAVVWG